MIIDLISDLHGETPEMPGGDLLIVAGDLTATDELKQYETFVRWLNTLDYKKKIVIAGNHDGLIESEGAQLLKWAADTEYLQDSGTEFGGLKIWGSPWTPEFCDWHFMKKRGDEITAKWDLIPDDIDILVTHGPPAMILDRADAWAPQSKHVGCADLCDALPRLKNLKLHVFGHIHESYGKEIKNGVTFVNCSHMNRAYEPVNEHIRVETHEKLYIY